MARQGCHITLYEQYSNKPSPMCAGRCIAGVRNEFQCSETKLLLWFACLSPCSRSCSSSRERKITTFDHGKILSCPAQLFSQLTIELVKRNFFEWLRQDQFTSFQDITNWYFMNSGQDYKVLLLIIFVTSEELFYVCFDTLWVTNYQFWINDEFITTTFLQ